MAMASSSIHRQVTFQQHSSLDSRHRSRHLVSSVRFPTATVRASSATATEPVQIFSLCFLLKLDLIQPYLSSESNPFIDAYFRVTDSITEEPEVGTLMMMAIVFHDFHFLIHN